MPGIQNTLVAASVYNCDDGEAHDRVGIFAYGLAYGG